MNIKYTLHGFLVDFVLRFFSEALLRTRSACPSLLSPSSESSVTIFIFNGLYEDILALVLLRDRFQRKLPQQSITLT